MIKCDLRRNGKSIKSRTKDLDIRSKIVSNDENMPLLKIFEINFNETGEYQADIQYESNVYVAWISHNFGSTWEIC